MYILKFYLGVENNSQYRVLIKGRDGFWDPEINGFFYSSSTNRMIPVINEPQESSSSSQVVSIQDDSEMEDSESQDVQSDSILLSISQELRNQTLTRIIDLQVP